MPKVKTITLDGGETAVKFENGYPYYIITNLGDDNIYASGNPDITAYADGVYTILPGMETRISPEKSADTVYLLGSGKVQVRAEEIAVPTSFKQIKKGGDVNTEYHGEFMPHMEKITAFFDMSSVDLINNKWHNRIGENSIILTDGSVENDSLKFSPNEFGTLTIEEPECVYMVLMKNVTETTAGSCLLSKTFIQNASDGENISIWNSVEYDKPFRVSANGLPYIDIGVDNLNEFHVFAITLNSDVNTSGYGLSVFIDGNLAGYLTGIKKGNYAGSMSINRRILPNGFENLCVKNTYIRKIAFGKEQNLKEITENSKYLLSLL